MSSMKTMTAGHERAEEGDTPPRMLMRMTSPDLVQWSMSGWMECWYPANSPPASAAKTPERTIADSWYRRPSRQETDALGFSRIDCSTARRGVHDPPDQPEGEEDDGHGEIVVAEGVRRASAWDPLDAVVSP